MAAWCFPRQILQMPVFIENEINSLLHQIFSLSEIPTGNRVYHSWKQIKVIIPSVGGFQGLRDKAFYLLQPKQQHSIYSWSSLTFSGWRPSLSYPYDFHGVDADILSRRWTWRLTYPGVLDKLWSRGRFHQTTPRVQELVLSQKRHFCGDTEICRRWALTSIEQELRGRSSFPRDEISQWLSQCEAKGQERLAIAFATKRSRRKRLCCAEFLQTRENSVTF